MKIGKVLLISLVLLLAISCGSKKEEAKAEVEKTAVKQEEVKKTEEKPEAKVTKDELPLEFTIKKPDSIGNVYMDAVFKNNSKYPVTSFDATVHIKDSNETVYFSTYDTVMPGETSAKFEASGPKTGKAEDYEVIKLEYKIETDNGPVVIDYDYKLNKYSDGF